MGHPPTSRWLIAGATTIALASAGLVTAGAASAAPPTTHTEVGLYGTTDPTYDGVYRQSLAILGLHAAGRAPRPEAIAWLERQQCADGGFPSYRASTATPCPPFDAKTFTGGEDTNATAVAIPALLSVGDTMAARRAAGWLRGLQNSDGGWEYTAHAGSGSDPNSTGLVLTALSAAHLAPRNTPTTALAYLAGLQAGRTPFDKSLGGIATLYSAGAPDLLATVQAVPGLLGADLTRLPGGSVWRDDPDPAPGVLPAASPTGVSHWATTWLAGQASKGNIKGANASWAVLAFGWDRGGEQTAYDLYAAQISGKVPAADPAANGQAALAAAVLGKTADVSTYARNIAATLQRDTTGPRSTVVRPHAPKRAASWKHLRVRATDVATAVASARVAVVQKRHGTWYSYNGHAWKKARNGKASTWLTAKRSGTVWRVEVRGLTKGELVVRATARDLSGNTGPVTRRVQRLSR